MVENKYAYSQFNYKCMALILGGGRRGGRLPTTFNIYCILFQTARGNPLEQISFLRQNIVPGVCIVM